MSCQSQHFLLLLYVCVERGVGVTVRKKLLLRCSYCFLYSPKYKGIDVLYKLINTVCGEIYFC